MGFPSGFFISAHSSIKWHELSNRVISGHCGSWREYFSSRNRYLTVYFPFFAGVFFLID